MTLFRCFTSLLVLLFVFVPKQNAIAQTSIYGSVALVNYGFQNNNSTSYKSDTAGFIGGVFLQLPDTEPSDGGSGCPRLLRCRRSGRRSGDGSSTNRVRAGTRRASALFPAGRRGGYVHLRRWPDYRACHSRSDSSIAGDVPAAGWSWQAASMFV